jgi:hypothetical protein
MFLDTTLSKEEDHNGQSILAASTPTSTSRTTSTPTSTPTSTTSRTTTTKAASTQSRSELQELTSKSENVKKLFTSSYQLSSWELAQKVCLF